MLGNTYDTIIIGAGPAGLIAAIESYSPAKKIRILEKMHKPALKLKITGKGRCNITNHAGLKDFISHFGKNGRFLKYAFSEFFNTDLLNYFEKHGVQFKLERGQRYFPQNDSAMEIANVLLSQIKSLRIDLSTHSEVKKILKTSDRHFIITTTKGELKSKNVLLAAGGKSYPKTGSSGDGFKLASQLGHTITPLSPSLVPIETKDDTAYKLQGLSLRNVMVTIWCENKKVEEQFGEMVFTDYGVSGPVIFTLSKTIVDRLKNKREVILSIDLKPALDHQKLDQRLLREIKEHSKQSFNSLLKRLLPKKLITVFSEKLKISGDKQLSQISTVERKRLRNLLKEFTFEVSGYRSYDEAIVTSGGISIKEINPQTMESKLVKGLYFAGEIIDISADTGGFNLQAAFSTGWIAGRSIRVSN